MDQNNMNNIIVDGNEEGQKKAKTSMIMGIVSVALMCTYGLSVVGIIFGIIALVNASKAKELGCEGGKRKAGFILGLIGLIGSAIMFVSCIACAGVFSAAGSSGMLDDLMSMF